ncbi:hypothetical protein ACLOJK_030111 [Asimina triloba]
MIVSNNIYAIQVMTAKPAVISIFSDLQNSATTRQQQHIFIRHPADHSNNKNSQISNLFSLSRIDWQHPWQILAGSYPNPATTAIDSNSISFPKVRREQSREGYVFFHPKILAPTMMGLHDLAMADLRQ